MAEQKILGLGFIGVGQAVARIFQQYPDIEKLPYRFVAACDLRQHSLDRFENQFGGRTYRNALQLCMDPDVDVVYVATPPEMHKDHCLLAIANNKHVIVEKPMALSLSECREMIDAADAQGVKLMAGHTHSFDAPIRKISEIVKSGDLGGVLMINSWNYNDFNARPWPTSELISTYGPLLNQGPHQIDIVRQIGGGVVRSLRGTTIWDESRQCVGGYSALLEFENGASASISYDARAYFDTAELYGWVGEGGAMRDPETNLRSRKNFDSLLRTSDDLEEALEEQKEHGRYGASEPTPQMLKLWGYTLAENVIHQPFFGITIVSCERGAIRQYPDGLIIYGAEGRTEIPLDRSMRGRAAELLELYRGIVNDEPIFHDGRWGQATLEVCFAILESATNHADVSMTHQVPV